MAEDAATVAPHAYKVLFENEQVRLLEVSMEPGSRTEMHSHPDNLVYILSDGSTRLLTHRARRPSSTYPPARFSGWKQPIMQPTTSGTPPSVRSCSSRSRRSHEGVVGFQRSARRASSEGPPPGGPSCFPASNSRCQHSGVAGSSPIIRLDRKPCGRRAFAFFRDDRIRRVVRGHTRAAQCVAAGASPAAVPPAAPAARCPACPARGCRSGRARP